MMITVKILKHFTVLQIFSNVLANSTWATNWRSFFCCTS